GQHRLLEQRRVSEHGRGLRGRGHLGASVRQRHRDYGGPRDLRRAGRVSRCEPAVRERGRGRLPHPAQLAGGGPGTAGEPDGRGDGRGGAGGRLRPRGAGRAAGRRSVRGAGGDGDDADADADHDADAGAVPGDRGSDGHADADGDADRHPGGGHTDAVRAGVPGAVSVADAGDLADGGADGDVDGDEHGGGGDLDGDVDGDEHGGGGDLDGDEHSGGGDLDDHADEDPERVSADLYGDGDGDPVADALADAVAVIQQGKDARPRGSPPGPPMLQTVRISVAIWRRISTIPPHPRDAPG